MAVPFTFLAKILLWFGKFIPWIVAGITWFNKVFSVVWTKLLVAYFGSRIAITITLLTFAVGVIYTMSEIGGAFGSLVGSYVLLKLEGFDNEYISFLLGYIDFAKVFECLFFFTSSWLAYFTTCKSLWIFNKSLLLLRTVQSSIK